MRQKHRSLEQWIYVLYIILLPILPEYFRIGGSPVFVYLGFFPFFAYLIKTKKIRIDKAYIKLILPLLIIAIMCFGVHKEFSSLVRYFMIPIVSTYIIRSYNKDEEQVYKTLQLLVYVGLVMCLFGLIERLLDYNVFSLLENVADYGDTGAVAKYRNGKVRVELSFGNPITGALYLLFINCLSFTLWKDSNTKNKNKIIYLMAYVLSFLVLIFTDSRMCIMTCVLMQMMFYMRGKWSKKVILVFSVITLLTIDFSISGIIYQVSEKYLVLIFDIFQNGQNTSDVNTMYRFALFPTLIPMIKEKFIFGYGNEFLSGYRFAILNGYAYSIDNMFLETFVRHGLFGFCLTMIPIIKTFSFSDKISKNNGLLGYNIKCLTIMYLINLLNVAQLGEQRLFFVLWAAFFVLANKNDRTISAAFSRVI